MACKRHPLGAGHGAPDQDMETRNRARLHEDLLQGEIETHRGGRGRGRFAAPAIQACRRGGISGSCSGSNIIKRWAAVRLAHLVQVWKAGGLLSKQLTKVPTLRLKELNNNQIFVATTRVSVLFLEITFLIVPTKLAYTKWNILFYVMSDLFSKRASLSINGRGASYA
nr:uncharacterized protein LOC127331860 isoform X1 [Lolium perenne]